MNVQFINPFLEGTVEVIKTMAFVEPRPGKPFLKRDCRAKGDVSAIIGLTGTTRGSIALSFSESCIIKIVSNMLGEEITALNGDIKDAVGEITNMVSGVARQKLEAERSSAANAARKFCLYARVALLKTRRITISASNAATTLPLPKRLPTKTCPLTTSWPRSSGTSPRVLQIRSSQWRLKLTLLMFRIHQMGWSFLFIVTLCSPKNQLCGCSP